MGQTVTHSAVSLASSIPPYALSSSRSERAPSFPSNEASRCGVTTPADVIVPSTDDLDTSDPRDAVLGDLLIPRPRPALDGLVGDVGDIGLVGDRVIPGIAMGAPRPRPRPMLAERPRVLPWGIGPGRGRVDMSAWATTHRLGGRRRWLSLVVVVWKREEPAVSCPATALHLCCLLVPIRLYTAASI